MVALLPRLRRFAYGLTGSLADADDLVQGACLKAIEHESQWRRGTRLDSWLYRILQNLRIDQARSTRGKEISMTEEEMSGLTVGDARRDMAARLDFAAVRREVAKLPEEQRAVLMLVSVDGFSYKEAAATLELPIGTVMSRLARARIALGKALGPDSGFRTSEARATL